MIAMQHTDMDLKGPWIHTNQMIQTIQAASDRK